jgi:hypothetical protein
MNKKSYRNLLARAHFLKMAWNISLSSLSSFLVFDVNFIVDVLSDVLFCGNFAHTLGRGGILLTFNNFRGGWRGGGGVYFFSLCLISFFLKNKNLFQKSLKHTSKLAGGGGQIFVLWMGENYHCVFYLDFNLNFQIRSRLLFGRRHLADVFQSSGKKSPGHRSMTAAAAAINIMLIIILCRRRRRCRWSRMSG